MSGTSNVNVSATVTGLAAGVTYYYQLEGTNSVGQLFYGSVFSFTTSLNASLPIVTTTAATSVGSTSATLNGTVNPNGATTTSTFCYSTSSTMNNCNGGTTVSASPTGLSGTTPGAVSANLTGLATGTTFYYRVVATNAVGTAYGALSVSYTHLLLAQRSTCK